MVLEFGTVPLPHVFGALRADHWLHLHPGVPAAQRQAIGAAMRAAFFSDDSAWQEAVVAQSVDAARAAVTHLMRAGNG